MSDLQLKITMGDIDINLQGEGEMVYKIFKELREGGLGALHKGQTHSISQKADESNNAELESSRRDEQTAPEKRPSKSRKENNSKQPQLIKNLDLSGGGINKSLRDFVAEKKPTTNIERTTVFVYYLQNTLQLTEITIDHIFSCYKDIGVRLPQNMQQNLFDTASSKYGYIEVNNGNYTMSILGTNFVEHDLPKKE